MRALPLRSLFVLALSLAPFAGCSSAPVEPAPDAGPVLAEAEALLAAGNYEASRELLESRDRASFPKRLQDRYDLTLARAFAGLGSAWESYLTLRDFADRYPHSELRDEVIALEYEIGRALIRSDQGFLFFWSDKRGGRTVLEHLVTRYPANAHLADALRLLGDLAFEEGDFELAQERFRDLLRKQPESEWVPYARFRFAMSLVTSLQGPEYDLDRMEHATNELRHFLEDPPENPEFVREATEALAKIVRWQAERHILIADFYATVGNEYGRRTHLAIAASPKFEGTPANAEAKALLGAAGTRQ